MFVDICFISALPCFECKYQKVITLVVMKIYSANVLLFWQFHVSLQIDVCTRLLWICLVQMYRHLLQFWLRLQFCLPVDFTHQYYLEIKRSIRWVNFSWGGNIRQWLTFQQENYTLRFTCRWYNRRLVILTGNCKARFRIWYRNLYRFLDNWFCTVSSKCQYHFFYHPKRYLYT